MGNINYDSFYKFLVSLGIILIIFPFTILIFFITNSFDLKIPEAELVKYTKTAQKVIIWRQSFALWIQEKSLWCIIGVCCVLGITLIVYGLKKWYELQKIEDICQKMESKKYMEAIEKNTVKMSDEQIIQKTTFENTQIVNGMKGFIIEQKFIDFVKKSKKTHTVKNNIMIGSFEYDVVAFSNKPFEKDYVYEIKYLQNSIALYKIEQFRENMVKLRNNFSEKFNHIPYMVLAIVVPDEMYEYAVTIAGQVKKWNNYSIEIFKESDI